MWKQHDDARVARKAAKKAAGRKAKRALDRRGGAGMTWEHVLVLATFAGFVFYLLWRFHSNTDGAIAGTDMGVHGMQKRMAEEEAARAAHEAKMRKLQQ